MLLCVKKCCLYYKEKRPKRKDRGSGQKNLKNFFKKVLTKSGRHGIITKHSARGHTKPAERLFSYIAGWSSLVARRAHNPKVGGSNPPPATIKEPSSVGLAVFSLCARSLPRTQTISFTANQNENAGRSPQWAERPAFCLFCLEKETSGQLALTACSLPAREWGQRVYREVRNGRKGEPKIRRGVSK